MNNSKGQKLAKYLEVLLSKRRPRGDNRKHHISALRPGLYVALAILGFGGCIASGYFVSSASAASLTLSVPNALSLNINSASGSVSKSSKANVSVKTDQKTGYTLSIKAKDSQDSNCLKNGDKKIKSISSSMSEEEYQNSGEMDTWAYQPDKFNSKTNTNFLPAPTASDTIIDKTTLASQETNNYGITLAAKISNELTAGIYQNDYVLTATANDMTYSVTYELNSGTGGPSPNPQTGSTSGSSFKLSSQVPTRKDYEFKGWCTDPTSDDTCTGGVYQAGANYTIHCDSNDLTLYAIWEKGDPSTMQEMTSSYCNSLAQDRVISLKDSRDGNTYKVAKLKDGKCWMVENLRLVGNKTLTSSDSNVSSSFTLPASSSTYWNDNYNTAYVHKATKSGYTDQIYYSWYAATAGTGTKNTGEGVNVSSSICPKGWRLPKGGSSGEFQTLYSHYNSSAAMRATPVPNFTLSGYYWSASEDYQGSYGYYWSSTSSGPGGSAYNAYGLTLASSSVFPAYGNYQNCGYSVRCLAS